MDVRVDEHGKLFTPRIAKNAVLALVATTEHLIVGAIYVRPGSRLTDELNSSTTPFLSMTDVSVYSAATEQLLYQTEFIVVAYQQVCFITELDLLADLRPLPWGERASETEAAAVTSEYAYVDRKGKVFSPRIPKDAIQSVLALPNSLILGHIHVRADRRLKDQLDEYAARLLPLTDAYVYRAQDQQLLYRASFLLVAQRQIMSVSPLEALAENQNLPWASGARALRRSATSHEHHEDARDSAVAAESSAAGE